MAIKSYTPPKLKLVDHRNPDGGFYTADCEICNTEFYPKRSNAKYCSPKCAVVAHRKAQVNGTVKKKELPKVVEPVVIPVVEPVITPEPIAIQKSKGEIFAGKDYVIGKLRKANVNVHGLNTALSNLEVGKNISWKGYDIAKLSKSRYEVVKN